ncbi:MAG: TerB family tellurite resistance protein [Phycisphaerales bacterium]
MNLLEQLKTTLADPASRDTNPEHTRELAAAVLLLEMEHADHDHDPREQDEIRRLLRETFHLTDDEVTELLQAARPAQQEAISLHRFIQVLNDGMGLADKRRVLEMLWRVAYADAHLDAHEEHLLRHLAELLHLPHREFIQAKLTVQGDAT